MRLIAARLHSLKHSCTKQNSPGTTVEIGGTLFIVQVLLEKLVSKVTRKQRSLQCWQKWNSLGAQTCKNQVEMNEMERIVGFTPPS